MDPFAQRILERAKARREKIDTKHLTSGLEVPNRKPLLENVPAVKLLHKLKEDNPKPVQKSPAKPRRMSKEQQFSEEGKKAQSPVKTNTITKSSRRKSSDKVTFLSPMNKSHSGSPLKKHTQEVTVTKQIYNQSGDRNSDVAVEINIMHSDDVQIEVQVEEQDVPVRVCLPKHDTSGPRLQSVKEVEDITKTMETLPTSGYKSGLRQNVKSRLERLGVLYSDKQNLSSPIHRTENDFTSATPPDATRTPTTRPVEKREKKKFGRLAALADEINNWEDDLTHHQAEKAAKQESPNQSTLEVSIHSLNDINQVLGGKKEKPKVNSSTFTKSTAPVNECQRLDKKIVAQLEADGFRRVSSTQSRLVYDFTTKVEVKRRQVAPKSATVQPTIEKKTKHSSNSKMATAMIRSPPQNSSNITKRPSIKKYKAPTPPRRIVNGNDVSPSDEITNDLQNNVVSKGSNDNHATDITDCCVQTKEEIQTSAKSSPASSRGSPGFRRFLPRNNNDSSTVMSKAAMFEEGQSPKRDPCQMSIRERKALFEKNKGSAIVPKAPFGQAPSAKALQSDRADVKPSKPIVTPHTSVSHSISTTSINSSKSTISQDTSEDTCSSGNIRHKVAALFNKEQTLSQSSIGERVRREREQELQQLQSRFQHRDSKSDNKMKPNRKAGDENNDPESIPLMSSAQDTKPEIVGKVPKVSFKDKSEKGQKDDNDFVEDLIDDLLDDDDDDEDIDSKDANDDDVIGQQPTKRRGSKDPAALVSVLDDTKRLRINNPNNSNQNKTNGSVMPTTKQPERIYPNLSEVESSENDDCGGNSGSDAANKSDNWGDTSFGREILKVVTKNQYEYDTTKEEQNFADTESSIEIDSVLNDVLDEALENDSDSEGPTPPKLNKSQTSRTSRSFTYKRGSPRKASSKDETFKSPLKSSGSPAKPAAQKAKHQELVHSVSFYRRLQNATSQPNTPVRVVRHKSPERHVPEDETPNSTQGPVTLSHKMKQLTAEISKQQTVISQASQALNLCAATVEFSSSTEQSEGERLLLLATQRRLACVHEMQRLQVEGPGPAPVATLIVSDLAVPLRRDYVRQLNADGATGHNVLLLLKCRDCVVATTMRRTRPDKLVLEFPDLIRMEGLTADFKVTIEVYLLAASKEALPHDLKYHINTKKQSSKGLLTPKGSKMTPLKAPCIESPGGPHAVRSPQFTLHGYSIFSMAMAQRSSFTLNKMPPASPLEGTVQAKIQVKVRAEPPPERMAFLTCFDDVGGLGHWHRRYAKLSKHTLAYWTYPDHVNKKLPLETVDLRTAISDKVQLAPRTLCARPNTLLLETELDAGIDCPTESLLCRTDEEGRPIRRHLLSADTSNDAQLWIEALNKALQYAQCLVHQD